MARGNISLAAHSPELVLEWSEKNGALTPEGVSYGSNKKAWWQANCGHIWQASIKNRVRGAGCPYCSGNRILKGFNDLLSRNPAVASEWSGKNRYSAEEVNVMSCSRAWWKCRTCGGEWQARIADRVTKESGCPYCSFAKIQSGINDFATWYPKLSAQWSADNGIRPDQVSAKVRLNVRWRCSVCGFEWTRSTHFRVKGSGCPECHRKQMRSQARIKRKLRQSFPAVIGKYSVFYYAQHFRIPFEAMDDGAIGIPLMAWFPEKHAAIEIGRQTVVENRISLPERIKDKLCEKSGIRMIRILKEDDAEHDGCVCIRIIGNDDIDSLSEAICTAYGIAGYKIETDLRKDLEKIKKYYANCCFGQ